MRRHRAEKSEAQTYLYRSVASSLVDNDEDMRDLIQVI
jgi:hypothetical protein